MDYFSQAIANPQLLVALAALLSALTAIVAIIVGPLLSYLFFRKQQRASVIVEDRKNRIEKFRDLVAELVAVCLKLDTLIDPAGKDWERFVKMSDELFLLKSKISMLIDRAEGDENEFLKLLNTVEHMSLSPKTNQSHASVELVDTINEVIARGQRIIDKRLSNLKQKG